jgi:hypothetical protein
VGHLYLLRGRSASPRWSRAGQGADRSGTLLRVRLRSWHVHVIESAADIRCKGYWSHWSGSDCFDLFARPLTVAKLTGPAIFTARGVLLSSPTYPTQKRSGKISGTFRCNSKPLQFANLNVAGDRRPLAGSCRGCQPNICQLEKRMFFLLSLPPYGVWLETH